MSIWVHNFWDDFWLGCYKITTVFSHAQTVVLCVSCSTVLAQPTGGRARLTEGKQWGVALLLGCTKEEKVARHSHVHALNLPNLDNTSHK